MTVSILEFNQILGGLRLSEVNSWFDLIMRLHNFRTWCGPRFTVLLNFSYLV